MVWIPSTSLRDQASQVIRRWTFSCSLYPIQICYCGPDLWNKLLADLKSITTVSTFKTKLKTFLYIQAFN